MIGLEREMTYRVRPRGPLGRTDGSPIGLREYWEFNEAELRDGIRNWLVTAA
jgi:hypothetical protein